MRRKYTDEELISELHRFYDENGRVPTKLDMTNKNGYPHHNNYINYFKTWNNALETAGYKPNRIQHNPILDGTETCSYCGKRADEILNFKGWCYPNGIRYCRKHGQGSDYVIGNLNINSSVGLGRAGEILVIKTLSIEKENDCNRISCHYKFDLIHEKYGKIDVKTSLLNDNGYNNWQFSFDPEKNPNNYICIGLSSYRKNVKHVWIVPNEDEIKDLQIFGVKNSHRGLLKRKHLEVNSKQYDNMWKTMKLDNCKIMVDKNKL